MVSTVPDTLQELTEYLLNDWVKRMEPFTSSGFCRGEQREGLADMEQSLLFVLFCWVKLQNISNLKSTYLYSEPYAISQNGTDPFVSLFVTGKAYAGYKI